MAGRRQSLASWVFFLWFVLMILRTDPVLAKDDENTDDDNDDNAPAGTCNLCGCRFCTPWPSHRTILEVTTPNGETFRDACRPLWEDWKSKAPAAVTRKFCRKELWKVAHAVCFCFDELRGEYLKDILAAEGEPEDPEAFFQALSEGRPTRRTVGAGRTTEH